MNKNMWNYIIPFDLLESKYHYNQEDWNQTLLTEFNRIYTLNRNKFMRDNNMVIVLASNKLKKLIETLYYYNENTNCLADRYIIHFFEPNKPFELSKSFEEDYDEYHIMVNSFYFILNDMKPINLQILNLE